MRIPGECAEALQVCVGSTVPHTRSVPSATRVWLLLVPVGVQPVIGVGLCRGVHNLGVAKAVAMNNMLGLHRYSEFMLAIKDTRQAAYLPDLDISVALGRNAAKNIRPFIAKRSAAANGGACQAGGSQPSRAPARVRHACETDSEEEQETVSTAGDDGNQDAVHSSATSANAAVATGIAPAAPAVPAIAALAGRSTAQHAGCKQAVVKGPDGIQHRGIPQQGSLQGQACVKRDPGRRQPVEFQARQPERPADRPSAAHGQGGAQRERGQQPRSGSPLRGRRGRAAAEQLPERAAAAPVHVKVERQRGRDAGGSSAAQQQPARHAVDGPGSNGQGDPQPLALCGTADDVRGKPGLVVKSLREEVGDRPRSEWAEGHSFHRAVEQRAGSVRGRSLEQKGERPTSNRATEGAGGIRGTDADSQARSQKNVRGDDASVARGDKARGALKHELRGGHGDDKGKGRGDYSRRGEARGALGDGAQRTDGEEARGEHRGVRRARRGGARPARRGDRERRVSESASRDRDSPDGRDLRGKRRGGHDDRIPSPRNARQHAHGRVRRSSPAVGGHQRQHHRLPSPTSLTWSSSYSEASASPRRDPQVAISQSRRRVPAEARREHTEEACRVMPKQEAATKPWVDSSMHDSGKLEKHPVGSNQAVPAVSSGRTVAVAAPDVDSPLVKPFVAPAATGQPPLPPDSPRSLQPPLPTGNPDGPQPPLPPEPTRSAQKRQGLTAWKGQVLSAHKPLSFDLAGMDGKLSAFHQVSLDGPRLAAPQDAAAAHSQMAVKEELKPASDKVHAAVGAVGHTPAKPAGGCAAAAAAAEVGCGAGSDSMDARPRPPGTWKALKAARALAPRSRSGPKITANRPIVDIPAVNDTGAGKVTKGHLHGGALAAHHAGDHHHMSISDMAFQNSASPVASALTGLFHIPVYAARAPCSGDACELHPVFMSAMSVSRRLRGMIDSRNVHLHALGGPCAVPRKVAARQSVVAISCGRRHRLYRL